MKTALQPLAHIQDRDPFLTYSAIDVVKGSLDNPYVRNDVATRLENNIYQKLDHYIEAFRITGAYGAMFNDYRGELVDAMLTAAAIRPAGNEVEQEKLATNLENFLHARGDNTRLYDYRTKDMNRYFRHNQDFAEEFNRNYNAPNFCYVPDNVVVTHLQHNFWKTPSYKVMTIYQDNNLTIAEKHTRSREAIVTYKSAEMHA